MTSRKRPRIGLALAGGGPLGAIYEIGALCALDDALVGRRLVDCDAFVGVSAGGFIAAALANGLTPRDLWASFIANDGDPDDIFEADLLLKPAWHEFGQRMARLPGLAASAALRLALGRVSATGALRMLGGALPAGLLSNEGIHRRLSELFAQPGRTNDFRQLARRLVLVATDLDSGESMPFGLPGHDDTPISRAVQASAAMPGLYPPVEIDGRHYVDGALKKTLHASVLLHEGLDFLFCVNPLVPFEAGEDRSEARGLQDPTRTAARRAASIPSLVEGGLPIVLAQTLRTLIHSRLEIGLKSYRHSHPRTTIVLFEPDHRDPALFLAGTFGYAQRRALAAHAYRRMLATLARRHAELATLLAPHGLHLDARVLAAADRLDPATGCDSGRSLAHEDASPLDRFAHLHAVLDQLEKSLARRGAYPIVKPPGKTQRSAAVITT